MCVFAAFQGSGEPADGEHGGRRRLRAQPGQQLQWRWTPPTAQQQRVGEVLHTWSVHKDTIYCCFLLTDLAYTVDNDMPIYCTCSAPVQCVLDKDSLVDGLRVLIPMDDQLLYAGHVNTVHSPDMWVQTLNFIGLKKKAWRTVMDLQFFNNGNTHTSVCTIKSCKSISVLQFSSPVKFAVLDLRSTCLSCAWLDKPPDI